MILSKKLRTKESKNLREWFNYKFDNPGIGIANIFRLIPTKGETSKYAEQIDIAFSYLFRFKMEQINETEGENSPESWTAYKELKKLTLNSREEAEQRFELAVKHFEEFVKNGIVSKELFESCLFIGQLDLISTTGSVPRNFGEINKDQINELRAIYEKVSWEQFKNDKSCVLNPSFGGILPDLEGNGDIIIGDTLIDINCSNSFSIHRFNLNRLISFYLLNLLYSSENEKKINKIGIYFARADFLWEMDMKQFHPIRDLYDYADEFRVLITDPNLNLVPIEENEILVRYDPDLMNEKSDEK